MLKQIKDWLSGRKTYVIAGGMVAIGLVKLVVGDMSLVDFLMSGDLQLLLEGLGIGFLRAGVAKVLK